MTNFSLPEKQHFDYKELIELSETLRVSNLKTELLHHLVNVCSLAQQNNSDDAGTEEFTKNNARLVGELLNVSIVPLAKNPVRNNVVWKDVLKQKLVDGKLDLADETVKKLLNAKFEKETKKIDKIIDGLVNVSASLKRSEGTIKFVYERHNGDYNSKTEHAYVRGLDFSFILYRSTIHFYLYCYDIPAGKDCKATVRVTIKNQAGEPDFVRSFKKVFVGPSQTTSEATNQTAYNSAANTYLYTSQLIGACEYTDESLGLMKDGKMNFEVFIRVDELFDKPVVVAKPATTTAAITPLAEQKMEATSSTTSAATSETTSATTSATTEQKVTSQ